MTIIRQYYRQARVSYAASAVWTAENPVLRSGEVGYESNTRAVKVGDGSTAWNSLSYITASAGAVDAEDVTVDSTDLTGTGTDLQTVLEELDDAIGAAGAPTDANYLVGTANGSLSAEIAVGTTPGGELGGTWASPTVDATHAGSTHSAASDTHIADTSDAHDASAISIADAGNDFTATDVEGALAELQADAEADATALTDHTGDTSDAHDASAISIADAGNDFTATTVEGALDELQADNEAHAAAADPHAGYVLESLLAAKGDLYVATADNTPGILTAGTDDYVLTADSGEATGLKWAEAAAGGSAWTQVVDQDGSSFAAWGSTTGTWASNSGVIKQTDTGDAFSRAYFGTLLCTAGIIVEAEVYIVTDGTDNISGIIAGFNGAGGTGAMSWRINGTNTLDGEVDGVAGRVQYSLAIAATTWYKLRLVKFGDHASLYIDGVLKGTMGNSAQTSVEAGYIGLLSYGTESWFRNIKAWTLTLPA